MKPQSCLLKGKSHSNGGNKLFWLHEWIKYWMFHFSNLATASPKSVELIYTSSLGKWPVSPGVLTVRLVYLEQLIFCLAAGCVISLTNILVWGVRATQCGAYVLSNGNLGWVTFQGKSLHLAFSKGLRDFSAGFTTLAPGTFCITVPGGHKAEQEQRIVWIYIHSVIPVHLLWKDSLNSKRASPPAVLQLLSLRCQFSSAKARWGSPENEIHLCWSKAGWVFRCLMLSRAR